jgi:MFS family permease
MIRLRATYRELVGDFRGRAFWVVLGCLVLFLTDAGIPHEEATLYFSNAIGLGIASKILLGLIADRIPHKATILLGYGLLAASSLLLLALPDKAPMWVFVAALGFSTAARDVVYPLIVSDCFGVRYMAQIYGGLMLVLAPAGALGPIFAAAIHDRFGSYDIAFTTFAVMNTLAVAALCFVRRESAPWRTGAGRDRGTRAQSAKA